MGEESAQNWVDKTKFGAKLFCFVFIVKKIIIMELIRDETT
jgi:hypothetical protein